MSTIRKPGISLSELSIDRLEASFCKRAPRDLPSKVHLVIEASFASLIDRLKMTAAPEREIELVMKEVHTRGLDARQEVLRKALHRFPIGIAKVRPKDGLHQTFGTRHRSATREGMGTAARDRINALSVESK